MATPTVTGVSPTVLAVGQTVTITGTNFNTAALTAVSFNGTPATSFTVVSNTTATAVAPAFTSGHLTVTNPTTTSATSPADNVTFGTVPTLTYVGTLSGKSPTPSAHHIQGSGLGFERYILQTGAVPANQTFSSLLLSRITGVIGVPGAQTVVTDMMGITTPGQSGISTAALKENQFFLDGTKLTASTQTEIWLVGIGGA